MTQAPSPLSVEGLIADLERAAKVLPRASAVDSEAMLAELTSRIATLGRGTPIPPELGERARRALAAFSAAVSVMRAANEARLQALVNAARPPAGYNGAGRPANTGEAGLIGSA